MVTKAEAVKSWRNRTKERIVKAFGGECGICGYAKSDRALSLHHLEPNEKDFSFSKIRANPKSWKKIVQELRKCIMVCANCHMEIHDGSLEVPKDIKRFNEEFSEYKTLWNKKDLTPCKHCSKLKSPKQIFCSLSCSGKHRTRVDWDSINIKKELETRTKVQLAQELGISESALRKRIKKLSRLVQ